jgi:hypothetical protein
MRGLISGPKYNRALGRLFYDPIHTSPGVCKEGGDVCRVSGEQRLAEGEEPNTSEKKQREASGLRFGFFFTRPAAKTYYNTRRRLLSSPE